MTDSKTVVEDLAAWLTQIWDEEERAAREDLEIVALANLKPGYTLTYQWSRQLVNANGTVVSSMFSPGAPSPTQVLARIAADRKILALHSYHMVASYDSHIKPIPGTERPRCLTCASQDESGEEWPCETVRLLASPHADRPGYQEEWKP